MEKSFFAQYSDERLGQTVLENEHGFISIDISEKFYIEHVFIKPESRGKSEADVLYLDAIEIAKKRALKKFLALFLLKRETLKKARPCYLRENLNFLIWSGK